MVARNLNNVFDQYLFLVVLGKIPCIQIYILHTFDFYRTQTKFAKVMFSQVFVCPQGWSRSLSRGGSPSSGWGGESPSRGVSVQGCLCPEGGSLPGEGVPVQGGLRETPPDRDPPPYSNERVVHILLKYILVLLLFKSAL